MQTTDMKLRHSDGPPFWGTSSGRRYGSRRTAGNGLVLASRRNPMLVRGLSGSSTAKGLGRGDPVTQRSSSLPKTPRLGLVSDALRSE